MAEKFRLLVKAKTRGFYGDVLHYGTGGKDRGHKRSGRPFVIRADALRYDETGRMLVNKDLKPILPQWVEPLDEVKAIDPKATPHVIVEPKRKAGKRVRPQEVHDASPESWPQNMKKHRKLDDDDREVKIKRAGPPGAMSKNPGREEDED